MYPVIILCGGLATRLGELARDTPKPLLAVNGKPFLFYQLRYLEKYGAREVYLSVSHLSEKVYEFLCEYQSDHISLKIIEDKPGRLGTGGAVKTILQKLASPSIVLYGDSYVEFDLNRICAQYVPGNGPFMMIYKNNQKYDQSNVHLSNSKIIYNKNSPHPSSEFIDYGVGIYEHHYFENFAGAFDLSTIQEKFSKLGKLQYGISHNRFYEIGTPNSYREVSKVFKS